MQGRSRLISCICGASESGKSILARKLSSLAGQPRIVIDPAGSWGEEGVWEEDPWIPLARCLKDGFSGTVILDDADSYLTTTTDRSTWGKIWTQHRHLGIDVIIIMRRIQDLPRVAFSTISRIFVFRTTPGGQVEKYLRNNGFLPDAITVPRVPFEFVECDLFAERWIRRTLTKEDITSYGNPRGK